MSNFGLSECNGVKGQHCLTNFYKVLHDRIEKLEENKSDAHEELVNVSDTLPQT